MEETIMPRKIRIVKRTPFVQWKLALDEVISIHEGLGWATDSYIIDLNRAGLKVSGIWLALVYLWKLNSLYNEEALVKDNYESEDRPNDTYLVGELIFEDILRYLRWQWENIEA